MKQLKPNCKKMVGKLCEVFDIEANLPNCIVKIISLNSSREYEVKVTSVFERCYWITVGYEAHISDVEYYYVIEE